MPHVPRAAILGTGLLVLAGGLALRPRSAGTPAVPEGPPESGKIRNRTALGSRGTRVADLLAGTRSTPFERRVAWAASLDDDELRRLTLELLDEHRERANDPSTVVPWLCALAMEGGTRDIERFDSLLGTWIGPPEGDGFDAASILFTPCRDAATVGLARKDPAAAWERLVGLLRTPHSTTNASLAAEAVARQWAAIDPRAAWNSLQQSTEHSLQAGGLRGLLATTDDPSLIDEILGFLWKTRASGSTRQELDGEDAAAITRNSIDAILNNPNRSGITSSMPYTHALAGLAERDPRRAWETAGSVSQTTLDGFLAEWTRRQPAEVLHFLDRLPPPPEPASLPSSPWRLVAVELARSDPARALGLLGERFPDASAHERLRTVVAGCSWDFVIRPGWPFLELPPEPLRVVERNRQMMALLPSLGLDPGLERRWVDHLGQEDPFRSPPTE